MLEKGCVYIVPLQEELALPADVSGKANPKSSTGRLDNFTRLITDEGRQFEIVPAGFKGRLYAEVVPGTFSVVVRQGERLSQLRLFQGRHEPSDLLLKQLENEEALIYLPDERRGAPDIQNGLRLSVDLEGIDGSGIIGYRAKRHAPLIDLARVQYYDPEDFWDPIPRNESRTLILDPEDFYILASRENVRIPAQYAAEMVPFDPTIGEFRIHYAGFFDPGFGYGSGEINGTRAVLEVRSHEVPFILEDGQVVASLVFEKLLERPSLLYGEGIGSSYQRQGLKLSKHFKVQTVPDYRLPDFDVVGVGLNATDTILLVPHFPGYGGKAPFHGESYSVGGQVASAMVTCARLGLRAKYIGTVGDDERGRIQLESLRGSDVNIDHVQQRRNCPNQSAYIIIDQSTGERTVFWSRPDCLTISPEEITPDQITCARLLHIDGHDTPAMEHAARIAREHRIPVTVDVDTIYAGFDRVLPYVDYLIASSEFPARWTGLDGSLSRALKLIQRRFGMKVAAMTLGAHGALALTEGRYIYSPAFVVNCIDTTGAGDVFHGAFCYSVLQRMPIGDALDFSNAMAALNCTAVGARGGIATLDEARNLLSTGQRRSSPEVSHRAQAR